MRIRAANLYLKMNDIITSKKPIFDISTLNFPDVTETLSNGEHPAPQAGKKFIVFLLGDELFGVSSAQVAEVTHPLPVTPLPNAAGWLTGIANLRSEIIPLIDLPVILGKSDSNLTPKSKWVVAHSEKAASSIAFTVDKLSELVTLAENEITKAKTGGESFIYAHAAHKGNVLQLIDLEKLLAALEG